MNGEVVVKVESIGATHVWLVHFDKYWRPCAVEPATEDATDEITIEIPRVMPVASEVLTAVRRHFGYSTRLSA